MATTVYKPAGLSVFPLHREPDRPSVLSRLLDDQPWRANVDWPEGFSGGIAHRLDNATSGAIIAADSLEELAELRCAFAEHRFTKRYLLLAAKDVPWDENVCDRLIAHHRTKRNRMVVQRGRETPHRGKWYPARTEFHRVVGSIFEARMCSGIMHQIRVHAAFVGIPIAGDRLYGGRAVEAARPSQLEQSNGPVFCLHHAGLEGEGFRSDPVPLPDWAESVRYAW